MTIATTDQKKARLLDLTTGILEMTRDGNRNIDEILDVFQVIKDDTKFATRLLAKDGVSAPAPKPVIPGYPADGEVFYLTLDGGLTKNQPLEMVKRDGYSGKWKYNGPVVRGKQTRRFKLVRVGYCRDLDEAREKLGAHGSIPEGQWREASKVFYPKPDGNGPVGFADPSWLDPDGHARFPCVRTDGYSCFSWASSSFDGRWRWLVEARE